MYSMMMNIDNGVVNAFFESVAPNHLFILASFSIFLFFLGYFFKQPISNIIERFGKKGSKKEKKEIPSAKDHYVFSSLEAAEIGIDSMEIKGYPEKSKMMRDCLRIMCKNLRDNLEMIVFNDENYTNSTLELQANIDKMLLRSIKEFNKNLKLLYRKQGLDIRDTNIIFQSIEQTRVDIRENVLKEIYKAFATGYNLDNNSAIVCILTVISASSKYMLEGFVGDFKRMNGAFDKYKWDYKTQVYLKK